MKKIYLTVWLLAGFLLCLSGANASLKNDDFSRHSFGWTTPASWPGKTEHIRSWGKKYLSLTPGRLGKESFVRALGFSRQIEFFAGMPIYIEITAKGWGELECGLLVYPFDSDTPVLYRAGKQKLSRSFSSLKFELPIPFRCRMILPFMEFRGYGSMLVQNFKMRFVSDESVKIASRTSLQIIKNLSQLQTILFTSNQPGKMLTVSQKNDLKVSEKQQTADSAGNLHVALEHLSSGLTEVAVSAGGTHAVACIDMNPDAYDRLNRMAEKIRFGKKVNILLLGDGLADFSRGRNSVDHLFFWLNKYNDGKVKIRNASVGGDHIHRVEERLLHEVKQLHGSAHQQNRYDRLFTEEYDYILIFLGQNDTRSELQSRLRKPLIDPLLQEQIYRRVLKLLSEHSKAQIILISPSPSYEKLFLDRAAKMSQGKNMVMFGRKKLVDDFDRINRKLCKELKLSYIDILTPMRNTENISTLFGDDGIHLTNAGNRLIAETVLCWFSENLSKSKK